MVTTAWADSAAERNQWDQRWQRLLNLSADPGTGRTQRQGSTNGSSRRQIGEADAADRRRQRRRDRGTAWSTAEARGVDGGRGGAAWSAAEARGMNGGRGGAAWSRRPPKLAGQDRAPAQPNRLLDVTLMVSPGSLVPSSWRRRSWLLLGCVCVLGYLDPDLVGGAGCQGSPQPSVPFVQFAGYVNEGRAAGGVSSTTSTKLRMLPNPSHPCSTE